jgi:hypothetical protein
MAWRDLCHADLSARVAVSGTDLSTVVIPACQYNGPFNFSFVQFWVVSRLQLILVFVLASNLIFSMSLLAAHH